MSRIDVPTAALDASLGGKRTCNIAALTADQRPFRSHRASKPVPKAGAIIDPFTRCGDPFAGRDYRGMANDRHQIAVAARFRPENAKPFSPLWKVTRSTRPARTS
jgi:hypothetical protein